MIGAVMFVLLIGLMFIGIPIAFSMGLSAVIMLLINATAAPVAITTRAVNSLDSFTTMAIPFFMMASFILTGSNVGVKIFRFASTAVRHLRGGLAHVNVLTYMIMAGMSGSAVSDVSGIGSPSSGRTLAIPNLSHSSNGTFIPVFFSSSRRASLSFCRL